MEKSELIYDWNAAGVTADKTAKRIEFDDETLRDGLQSSSIIDPPIAEKIKILHLMNDLGIHSADIGLAGAGPRMVRDVTALAQEIVRNKLTIKASCAARTLKTDITPIIEISQKVGLPLCVDMFIASSGIRKYVEEWSTERMLNHTIESVRYAVAHQLPVMYVTEDTTRAHPETIRQLYTAAIDHGATRICLCDTVGHATPYGIWNLIHFTKGVVEQSGTSVSIDFHGHNDRGLSLANALTAIMAGADRVHGCGLGIGERAGNTPLELLLVNLKLLGWIDNDLCKLPAYCQAISQSCGAPLPYNYPVFGSDAFRTATGVHAAAVIKAIRREQDSWLADVVYSGVPAGLIGKKQQIEIGPMSGKSNVIFWLEQRGICPEEALVNRTIEQAKQSNRLLTEEQIRQLISEHQRQE